MNPSIDSRLGMIRTCVADLRDNGIDLAHADDRQIAALVHEHIDYFQLMMGYEPEEREVLSLIHHEIHPDALDKAHRSSPGHN